MSENRGRRGWRDLPLISIFLGLAAFVIYFFPEAAAYLQYDRQALAAGEWWRAVTGHWTHWSWDHLIWDALVFTGLGAACERYGRKKLMAFLIGSVLLVPAVVWVFLPDMNIYRGLSGLDAGLFIMLAFLMTGESIREGHWSGVAVLSLASAAFLAKVGYEMTYGRAVFVRTDGLFTPVPIAHLAGAAVGALAALLISSSGSERRKQPCSSPCC
jgi:rhomboid family GlyGly-CTERM serine protease